MPGFSFSRDFGGNMRLDKFLKVSRIIKRRTIANEACDQGRVTVNGKVGKAGFEVSIGDVIEIRFGENRRKYEIVEISEHVARQNAINMYRELLS